VGGEVGGVLDTISVIQREAARQGLILNPAKSELIGATGGFIPENQSTQISSTSTGRMQLSWGPHSRDGIDRAIAEKIQDLSCLLVRLQHLPMHDALFLLKNALAMPKLRYILRTFSAFESEPLTLCNITLSKQISKLLNVSFKRVGGGWAQASLPLSLGGVGQTKRCLPST